MVALADKTTSPLDQIIDELLLEVGYGALEESNALVGSLRRCPPAKTRPPSLANRPKPHPQSTYWTGYRLEALGQIKKGQSTHPTKKP